jgi:hypothetical protein
MTLWVIPQDGDRKRRRLIDRSFTPRFYVHGSEAQLRRLAQTLAQSAAGRATCTFTERTNIWDGRPLNVLQVSVRFPTRTRPWRGLSAARIQAFTSTTPT